jgi:hypothetical protein
MSLDHSSWQPTQPGCRLLAPGELAKHLGRGSFRKNHGATSESLQENITRSAFFQSLAERLVRTAVSDYDQGRLSQDFQNRGVSSPGWVEDPY